MKLTPQREVFAGEIAKGKTQAEAYRIAFPRSRNWTPATVRSKASELAANGDVRGTVERLRAKASANLEVSVERVLAERARMAFVNPADLVDDAGKPIGLKQLPEDVARGVLGVKVGKYGPEYRLAKDAALSALERHLGMYASDENGGRKAGVINILINLGG